MRHAICVLLLSLSSFDRLAWHRSWSSSSGSAFTLLLHLPPLCSQEINDAKLLVGCLSTAIWPSWFTSTGEIFKIHQDLIDALHCCPCFGIQVLLKNLSLVLVCHSLLPVSIWTNLPRLPVVCCIVLKWQSSFLRRASYVICWTSQPKRETAGFVPRLAPIAFGECQLSS